MNNRASAVYVAIVGIAIAALLVAFRPGQAKKAPPPVREPSLTETQKAALAHAARGSAIARKNPDEGIAELKLAVKMEPENRRWKGFLAFALHHDANRTADAIPIWRELARGSDDEAKHAARWLKKVGAN